MSLRSDEWVDRRRLKRHLTVWRLIAIGAVIAAVLVGLSRFAHVGDHVARLSVDGVILDDRDRDRAITGLIEDPGVRAVIVQIDSPGGTVVGGEVLYTRLKALAEVKPVAAVIGQLGTSAAYMAALGTDRIFAREGSVTGSIGVILQTAVVADLLKSIGIEPTVLKSGPLKAQPNPFEPFTEEAREVTMGVVLDMYAMFVDMVAERRKLDREEVESLADGRVFTGRQALENGLIDAIGGEEDAIQWLQAEHGIDEKLPVKDVEIEDPSERVLDLVGRSAKKALFSEGLILDGLVSVWHPSL
jgi:protease-4